MKKKDFAVIQKEIQRRKGEDSSEASPEEQQICERVTGYKYNDLWKKENALKF